MAGGFSQGGAISLFTGLTGPHELAGFFGLSSYLSMHSRAKEIVAATAPAPAPDKTVPVFMGHGNSDPLVKYNWALLTAQTIQDMGWKVDLHMYKHVLQVLRGLESASNVKCRGLVHSVDPKEIVDLKNSSGRGFRQPRMLLCIWHDLYRAILC